MLKYILITWCIDRKKEDFFKFKQKVINREAPNLDNPSRLLTNKKWVYYLKTPNFTNISLNDFIIFICLFSQQYIADFYGFLVFFWRSTTLLYYIISFDKYNFYLNIGVEIKDSYYDNIIRNKKVYSLYKCYVNKSKKPHN